MKTGKTIGFLGAGNMAEALISGLHASGLPGQQIAASDTRSDRLSTLSERYGLRSFEDNAELVKASDVLVLAVKPQFMKPVVEQISHLVTEETTVISIAAGLTIDTLENWLPAHARFIRAMPNAPAIVGAGATAICPGTRADAADMALAEGLFNSVGITMTFQEEQLDAVTGLSGSGPAYVFVILDALSDAGVKVGLSRDHAQRLAAQTVLGAAKMLLDSGAHPSELKDRVASPGGTTISGLHALEKGGIRTALINAVEAATARSRELGQANPYR